MKNPVQLIAFVVVVSALGVGCQTSGSSSSTSRMTARAAQLQSTGSVQIVPRDSALYFGTDTFQLDEASMSLLNDYADLLAKDPTAVVTISGHADERGPTEYNLALGEARARAARRYLLTLGVKRHQINIVTLGEERPAVEGEGEAVWSQNRRDEIVVAFGK